MTNASVKKSLKKHGLGILSYRVCAADERVVAVLICFYRNEGAFQLCGMKYISFHAEGLEETVKKKSLCLCSKLM